MTSEFILRVLHETSKSDQHAAQQMLALLQTIVPYWPPHVSFVGLFVIKFCILIMIL